MLRMKCGVSRKAWLASVSAVGLMGVASAALAEVPNDNLNRNLPPTLAGANVVNGIGNVITDAGGGSVGICTGTLINPRTVIFAAHCVNTAAATSYGSLGGGTPISVGFKGDARPGLLNWLFTGNHDTSYADQHYNMSRVFYDPLSLQAKVSGGFYEADIAIGVLDSPTKDVPSWALLFSPLTGDEDRHVTIGGYGRSGTGTTGSSVAVDFRRRSGENMIGALASLDDVNLWLFGNGSQRGLGQNLYMVDFDDPKGTSRFDFNLFGDDVALPGEGITAAGDSGGPLILDRAFDIQVVAGVLSLGTTYFNGQPSASYGTMAGYQPLYLFTDWIVANNPYKYVSALAGDADWFDAKHWVQDMDPNYKVIGPDGKLMTGLPDTPSQGVGGKGGEWGSICYQKDCIDASELADFNNNRPGGASETASPEAAISDSGYLVTQISDTVEGVSDGKPDSRGAATAGLDPRYEGLALGTAPGATAPFELLAGGPGTKNFVPFNVQGRVSANEKPAFYDVTLRNEGVTSLNQAAIIDRFTLAGSNSSLNIGAKGLLIAENDVNVFAGILNVDGVLATREFLLAGGLLSGSGTIDATYLTSVMGSIAPGGQGKIGTLTMKNDLILASGSRLFIDVSGAQSDRLVITADAAEKTTGIANIGGLLGVNFLAAPKYGQKYTILTAEGGVVGKFDALTDIKGVLYPVLNYSAKSVGMSIEAASYAGFIDPTSRAQRTVGGILDAARISRYDALADIYGVTDILEGPELHAGLESLSPFSAHSSLTLLSAQTETLRSVVSGRIALDRRNGAPQGLAILGQGVQVASIDANATASAAAMAAREDASRSRWGGWREGVSGYFGGGALDGEATQLRSTIANGQKDDQSAWYVIGGLEQSRDGMTFGGNLAYAEGKAEFASGLSKAENKQVQASLYAAAALPYGAYVGAHVGYGSADIDTDRRFAIGATSFRTEGSTSAKVVSGGGELGFNLRAGGLTVQPNIGLDAYSIDIDGYDEKGSAAALRIQDQSFDALQHHVGVRFGGDMGAGRWTVKPALDVRWVHDLSGDTRNVNAAFVAADAFGGVFAGASNDREWGEVAGSVEIGNDRATLILKAASMIDRKDLDYQTYSATIAYRF